MGAGRRAPDHPLVVQDPKPFFFCDCGGGVVLLKRHSSIVRRPGRTCKHVRAPITHPTVSEGVLGSCVITHAATWGGTY